MVVIMKLVQKWRSGNSAESRIILSSNAGGGLPTAARLNLEFAIVENPVALTAFAVMLFP